MFIVFKILQPGDLLELFCAGCAGEEGASAEGTLKMMGFDIHPHVESHDGFHQHKQFAKYRIKLCKSFGVTWWGSSTCCVSWCFSLNFLTGSANQEIMVSCKKVAPNRYSRRWISPEPCILIAWHAKMSREVGRVLIAFSRFSLSLAYL